MNNISITAKFFSLFLFFIASNKAIEVPQFLHSEHKNNLKIIKLMFEGAEVENALYKNAVARVTLYVYWMTHVYISLSYLNTPGITFKNLLANGLAGMWLGVSVNWYKHFMNNKDVLEAKYEFYKEAIKQIEFVNVDAKQVNEITELRE